MFILAKDPIGTIPPSTPFLFVVQTEDDRAALAELVDLANANRCEDPKLKAAGQIGRVFIMALSEWLGMEGLTQEYINETIELGKQRTGITGSELMRCAFFVRFLHW